MYELNPELSNLSDQEIAGRIGLLSQIAFSALDDPRVVNPLRQMDTLLHELIARHPVPQKSDQVVGLSTLNMKGEAKIR